ncbi:ImmA/IrrE family metallo-endopeptidase [Neobacillus niacini]|uniref:ImmA/IrrE family metallo-endopeptidase n=1 Tax=Neobacillus niacini TaxID=86668 RepID=UPI0028600232|nr:ImmA/IrrE family metallo-endopeptidase [Neobacillus niacini]MDR7000091.1 Zn-dependent peptidase ImmA (M78 family) [Neobacillus niacini]
MREIQFLPRSEVIEIESKANGKLAELHKHSHILGKHVLNIIKREATLIQSPFPDEDFCAFVCKKKDHLFVYINSQIPEEKQHFAAAHELYHIWFDQEYLHNPEMLKSDILDDETADTRELRANLFAAMLLVPKNVLEQELLFLGISKNNVSSMQAVELADTFQVPYKTMVRRLYEIDFIEKPLMNKLWLEKNVPLIRKKLQLEPQNPVNPIIHYEGLVEKALDLYQDKHISPKKLQNLLALIHKEPKEFGINLPNELPSEQEIDSLLDEEDNE